MKKFWCVNEDYIFPAKDKKDAIEKFKEQLGAIEKIREATEKEIEDYVANRYARFKKLVENNTQLILACLKEMNDDGTLKYIANLDNLTTFEKGYINSLLNGGTLQEKTIYHPLARGEYEISKDDFRVSEKHPYLFLISYKGQNLIAVDGMDEDEAWNRFVEYCNKNKDGYWECKSRILE